MNIRFYGLGEDDAEFYRDIESITQECLLAAFQEAIHFASDPKIMFGFPSFF